MTSQDAPQVLCLAEYGAVHILAVRGGKITRFREFVDLARPISP